MDIRTQRHNITRQLCRAGPDLQVIAVSLASGNSGGSRRASNPFHQHILCVANSSAEQLCSGTCTWVVGACANTSLDGLSTWMGVEEEQGVTH